MHVKKIFIGPSEWRELTGTRFHNDNRYILSLNWSTSTIQKSNTPIKITVTTTGIPVKNNVIFGTGIFHTADGLKVLGQAKINVRQMSRGDSFGCVIFKILWDNGAKTQPRQNTDWVYLSSVCKVMLYAKPSCFKVQVIKKKRKLENVFVKHYMCSAVNEKSSLKIISHCSPHLQLCLICTSFWIRNSVICNLTDRSGITKIFWTSKKIPQAVLETTSGLVAKCA